MRFIVASSSVQRSDDVSRLLGTSPQVEIRHGSIAEVSADCDAAVVHYTIAHDRYGGAPVVGKAQVLQNSRNDGAPPVILATPPLESGAGMVSDLQAEIEDHTARMLGLALTEWVHSPFFPQRSTEAVCLLHIEGAGLDFGDFEAIMLGVKRVIHVGH